LSNNNLLNSFQSAFIKSPSIETTLLSVHDHLIKATSPQQGAFLTLLGVSDAFDTIDHSIYLERLSSFGITSTAPSWIQSYMLNRSVYVNVENTKSSLFQLLYDVFQGSVLELLLFILYTTPVSTVITNSSVLIISMRMIFNFSYNSLLLTLYTISLILNIQYLMSSTGCNLTFIFSVPLRLRFFLFVILTNSQNSVTLSLIYLIHSVTCSFCF
jgi:Reverse transcriptase (RNA-dependent DNA polymerase)